MSRSKFSYQQEIEELKRALIAKDKEIERIKFGTLTFYGRITQLESNRDYIDLDIMGTKCYGRNYYPEYTLEIKLNHLRLTEDDMKRLMSFRNLKFTAELDNES